jgi:undecaprenyl-diphosphatase
MFQAVVLGAVQGLTEFVPVSSSAHLVLVPFLLRWPIPDLSFDVAVHIGTALGVVAYFARDIAAILVGAARTMIGRADDRDRTNARLVPLLVLGSIPAAVAGFLLEDLFEDLFTTDEAVDRIGAPITALFLLVTAVLLIGAEAVHRRRPDGRRGLVDLTPWDALVIGILQAVSIAPGISRSGATITAGIVRGLTREAAARFSFLLSLPAILGAGVVALPDVPADADLGPLIAGGAVAAVTGFAAVAFLLRYLRTRTLRPFAAYCVALAAVALAVWLAIR